MSYSMHSPTQGYTNPPTDVYNSRAYATHLMGPNTMNNYSPGYLRDDPYSGNSNTLQQYSNGVGLQSGSHYSGNSSISHHTYLGSMNHFGHQPDIYNSCVGPSRNTSYPIPNTSNLTNSRHSINSKSYWSCDPVVSQPPNHCYPSSNASLNSTHKTPAQNWSRSPNVISSPSSTPSPIPCSSTPHPFVSSSPHHSETKPFNGQMIPSHSSLSSANSSGANSINCNSNPLQSLQKMVQIDSEGSDLRYDNSSTVPMVNQHSQMNSQQQQQPQQASHPPSQHPPHPLSSLENEPNYPTYYNLDQNRLCATPQTSYPNLSAQSSSVPFSSMKSSHSPETRTQQQQQQQQQQEKNHNSNNESSDINNLTRTNSIRFSNKMSNKNNSSCSTDTCSNESPSTQSTNKVSSIAESIIHADQTHDSMNSFRGSETTANSRDSVKSSDSDAVSSYTVSQCPTPNNTWKINTNANANQTNEFRSNNFSSQTKSWWSENSTNNRSFASMVECNQYNSGSYPMSRLSQSNASALANQSWSQQVNMSNQSQMLGNLNYGSQPDGVVKKKRGRPFGSKNRRSLEGPNQIVDPNKRKRKSVLIDIGINTNLSFDVQASWNHDDSITFSEPLSSIQHPLPLATRRKKVVGPVIRIDKTCFETNNAKYSIVNNSLKISSDEERDHKSTKPPSNTKISNEMNSHSRKNNLSKKSFLSSNHTNNTEKNWFCVLCHKGPHHKGLGDLYGPYFISFENSKILDCENEFQTDDTKDEIEQLHEPTMERRSLRKRTPESNDEKNRNNIAISNHFDYKETNKTEVEVWIHEDCIVWSNNVYLEGTKIRNLEPAIVESFENICTKCKLPGATLGCIYKNCNVSPLHYLCAKEKDCDLDEEKFILSCSKHKKRRIIPKDETRNEMVANQEITQ